MNLFIPTKISNCALDAMSAHKLRDFVKLNFSVWPNTTTIKMMSSRVSFVEVVSINIQISKKTYIEDP